MVGKGVAVGGTGVGPASAGFGIGVASISRKAGIGVGVGGIGASVGGIGVLMTAGVTLTHTGVGVASEVGLIMSARPAQRHKNKSGTPARIAILPRLDRFLNHCVSDRSCSSRFFSGMLGWLALL